MYGVGVYLVRVNRQISAAWLFAVIALFLVSLVIPAAGSQAQALSGSQFNPGRIIDDSVFYDTNTMSANQIQNFLASKVPDCDTHHPRTSSPNDSGAPYICLKNYKQNTKNIAPESGLCNGYSGANSETAATIIYKVAKSCGINPQVLLVMLQKEQSLITDTWPWKIQYDKAMGAFCPDTAPCDPAYKGFFYQVYYGAHRFKVYKANPNSFNYKAGRNNSILWHPNAACGRSTVYIENQATASLYIYTPYRPNNAALKNLYGEGDGCSSYGNRNFWRIFNDWFGSTTRSVLFRVQGSNTYYLEWGDFYYAIPSSEILSAFGLTGVAPRTVSGFPQSKTRGPALQRSAKFGSDDPNNPHYTAQVSFIDGGKRHDVPNWSTLASHGYNDYTSYDPTLSYLLKLGDPLRPVVRKPNGAIYLMQDNKKRGFPDSDSYYKLTGPNINGVVKPYSQHSFTNMSSSYINSKQDGAPMLVDGKAFAVHGSPAIYMFYGGKKHLFSADSYANWGGKFDYLLSKNSTDQVPSGNPVPYLIKTESGTKYMVNDGKRFLVEHEAMESWGINESSFTTLPDLPIKRLRKSGNVPILIQYRNGGVFLVENGEKHGIPSLAEFSRLGLRWKDVTEVSGQVFRSIARGADKYAPGSLVRKPNGAVFITDDNYVAHGVSSGSLFTRFGFEWSKVANVSNVGLEGYQEDGLQTLLIESGSNKLYVVDRGAYHYIDSDLAGLTRYNLNDSPKTHVHPLVLNSIKPGRPMSEFIRSTESPTVYYIENGKRRPIATEEAFFNIGGTWSKVVDVSQDFLEEIPKGPKL